jgi:hypothetical protein
MPLAVAIAFTVVVACRCIGLVYIWPLVAEGGLPSVV